MPPAGIGWVLNGPSISLQCCIVLPFTEQLFIACFGISVGSFNFQGFNANLMQDTASFNLQNVLGISDVYCKDRKVGATSEVLNVSGLAYVQHSRLQPAECAGHLGCVLQEPQGAHFYFNGASAV